MFRLCSTELSVIEAIKVLSNAEYVILDCEGRDLGSSSGALSLLSLGTSHASDIFLFDALVLPHDALLMLFNAILSLTPAARAKTKVVWDGRMDHSELFYGYSCPIENVLDLQLADVLSREKRKQSDWHRMGRFARKAFPMSEVRKLQLEEVHILNGMDGAIKEHGVIGAITKDASIKKLHADNLSDIWMQRPLSNELLGYAAADITRIAGLYDHFLERGYLKDMDHLRQLSSLYVTMHQAAGRPDENNMFLRGPFLPLTIPLSVKPRGAASGIEPSKKCSKCNRMILERHFPVASKKMSRKMHNAGQTVSRLSTCKVCTFILVKAEYVEKQKSERAERAERARKDLAPLE